MSPQDDGNIGVDFEHRVARLYESLGYRVRHNIVLSGQQCDLLVTRTVRGIGLVKMLIECKWRSRGTVRNQEVHDFVAFIRGVHEREAIGAGIMVANTGFSASAKAAADASGLVRLLAVSELEHDVFDVRQIFSAFAANYEESGIYGSYITLDATSSAPDTKLSSQASVDDVESCLMDWAQEPDSGFATVVGDYGAGKTTLLDRLKYNLTKSYVAGTSTLKPFMVRLRDFHSCGSLEGLLRHTINTEFGSDLPMQLFWLAVNRGEIVLLLDGFDEMSPRVDSDRRLENMLLLSSVVSTN